MPPLPPPPPLPSRNRRLWLTHGLPPIAFAASIWVLSSQSRLPSAPLLDIPHADKAIHALTWLVLAWLTRRALAALPRTLRHADLWAWFLAAAWGGLDEWHQAHVPGRSSDAVDWCADAFGAAVGVALWRLLSRHYRSPTREESC